MNVSCKKSLSVVASIVIMTLSGNGHTQDPDLNKESSVIDPSIDLQSLTTHVNANPTITVTRDFSFLKGTWNKVVCGGVCHNTQFEYGMEGDVPVYGYPVSSDPSAPLVTGVYRRGTWYINLSNGNYLAGLYTKVVSFGTLGDIPMIASFDVLSQPKIAVFRPSNGTWYISKDNESWRGDLTNSVEIIFGQQGDQPFVLKNGSLGIYRPSNGEIRIRKFEGSSQEHVVKTQVIGGIHLYSDLATHTIATKESFYTSIRSFNNDSEILNEKFHGFLGIRENFARFLNSGTHYAGPFGSY